MRKELPIFADDSPLPTFSPDYDRWRTEGPPDEGEPIDAEEALGRLAAKCDDVNKLFRGPTGSNIPAWAKLEVLELSKFADEMKEACGV